MGNPESTATAATGTSSNYRTEVIDPGDRASKIAKEACFSSHNNCPALTVVPHNPGDFRGAVSFLWKPWVLSAMQETEYDDKGNLLSWTMIQSEENDGAGSKPSFFTLAGDVDCFYNLPWEIITMTADDFARTGRLACFMSNDLNTKSITAANLLKFERMMEGFQEHLKASNLVNITGETAIMKFNITSPFDNGEDDQLIVNWGASCGGLTHRDLLIDGSKILPGQPIVGFEEEGYRCNGGTRLINLIKQIWGDDVEKITASSEAMNLVRSLTIPSHSYAKTVSKLVGWEEDGSIGEPLANITGIAHVTGGGLWGKFGEILPEGVGACLDKMIQPADCLLRAQLLSLQTDEPLSDWNAYDTFHGGCGMMLICKDNFDAQAVIAIAKEDGIKASIVGYTNESQTNEVTVCSQFSGYPNTIISSEVPF